MKEVLSSMQSKSNESVLKLEYPYFYSDVQIILEMLYFILLIICFEVYIIVYLIQRKKVNKL